MSTTGTEGKNLKALVRVSTGVLGLTAVVTPPPPLVDAIPVVAGPAPHFAVVYSDAVDGAAVGTAAVGVLLNPYALAAGPTRMLGPAAGSPGALRTFMSANFEVVTNWLSLTTRSNFRIPRCLPQRQLLSRQPPWL